MVGFGSGALGATSDAASARVGVRACPVLAVLMRLGLLVALTWGLGAPAPTSGAELSFTLMPACAVQYSVHSLRVAKRYAQENSDYRSLEGGFN